MALRGRFLKTAHCPTTRAVCKLQPSVRLQNPSCFRGLHPASSIAEDIRGKMIWCEHAALDSCFRHCKSWPQGLWMDPIFLAEKVTQGLMALSQKGTCGKKKWGASATFCLCDLGPWLQLLCALVCSPVRNRMMWYSGTFVTISRITQHGDSAYSSAWHQGVYTLLLDGQTGSKQTYQGQFADNY